MRRWNGWGDDSIAFPLPENAREFLASRLGPGSPPRDVTIEQAVGHVPQSRLPAHRLVTDDAMPRLLHARGQSLPDWVALRGGRIARFPDGVAFPENGSDVRDLISFSRSNGISMIPYGGGTSVAGHVNAPGGPAPVLSIDLSRLNGIIDFDETSRLATFQAGISGPDLEAHLRALGYTLGHFPQSFEYSTLGGWIATRSSGQQSLGYGRIERLFAGGLVETPRGAMRLPSFPASAAGPDLREIVLGSEGRAGIITEATMRVTRLPEEEVFRAFFLPDWASALNAAREIVQARLPLSMLRVSTAVETETTITLAGHRRLIRALERVLALRGAGPGKCMLLVGFSGASAIVRTAYRETRAIASRHGGVHIGRAFGRQWHKNRFRTPYLRNSLWAEGYAVDTLETAVDWRRVPTLLAAIEDALCDAIDAVGERIHVFTHLSHLYPDGASIYTTYVFRIAGDPEETIERWRALKSAASSAIVAHGGTISHQHGVGADHLPYLPAEKGEIGIAALRAVCGFFDPEGLMNPGKLVG